MRRLLATVLLLYAIAAVPSSSLARSSTARGASLCQLGLNDTGIPDQCFPPSRVALVEAKMPVKPVRPLNSVRRITHLRLTQLELRDPEQSIEIRYLFGNVPVGRRGLPDLASHATRYVIVGEVIGLSSLSKPQLFRYKNADGSTAYIEWGANFRCRNLYLHITSNLHGAMVQALGRSILSAEVCGKLRVTGLAGPANHSARSWWVPAISAPVRDRLSATW